MPTTSCGTSRKRSECVSTTCKPDRSIYHHLRDSIEARLGRAAAGALRDSAELLARSANLERIYDRVRAEGTKDVCAPASASSRYFGNYVVMDSAVPSGVFVHPRGLCESDHVGAGTRIWAFAHVLAGAAVGQGCNICDHAYVESGVTIGDRVTVKNGAMLFDGVTIEDDVFLGPGVLFTNDLRPRAPIKRGHDDFPPTLVQVGATLGAGVVVVCGLKIGAHAFVGAGAVVTRNVPAYGFVVGNPARLIGWACECGAKLQADLSCVCGRKYRQESTGLAKVG